MRYLLTSLLCVFTISLTAQVQSTVDCDIMSLSVSASDTGYVHLYHPGHYLTHPQSENYIAWEVTSQGNLIAQDTLVDDAFYLFSHNVPITGVMFVTAHLWNDSAVMPNGNLVNCLIEDILYWEVTEIIPGSFIGNWNIELGNVGVDQNGVLGIDDLTPNIIMENKEFIKIVDISGREVDHTTNQILFHIYDDGSVEKKVVIE